MRRAAQVDWFLRDLPQTSINNKQTERTTPPVAAKRPSAGPPRPPRARDQAYWVETGRLVMTYFELEAGARFSDALEEGFVVWLQRSPGERRTYEQGDDMQRAAQVDWFLRVVC